LRITPTIVEEEADVMCTEHLDQALVLRAVLVKRPQLVTARPKRSTWRVFESGDRRSRFKVGINQIFSQGTEDAISASVDLSNLVGILVGDLQQATGRGVDHRTNPT
jgi:hypothetical protein